MPLIQPEYYLVIIDIRTLNEHQRFFTELQSSLAWWHFLGSTWIVQRNETLVELQGKLLPLVYQADRLLILPARGPAGGWLTNDAWEWMNSRLPRLW